METLASGTSVLGARVWGNPMGSSTMDARKRRSEAIVAGLPADVMDELVADMAEAVLAMLSEAATEADGCDEESGDLRQIQ